MDHESPLAAAEAPRDVLAEAAREGIDLSLLRQALRLTPTERLRTHQACLRSVLDIQEAGAAARRGR